MKISKKLQQRINKAVSEKIEIVPYNPNWVREFEKEAAFLKKEFPNLIKRIEHFGSTSIPGLSSKPIVDMLIEVPTFKETKQTIVPHLISLGYEYFWRPEFDKPPMYAWFIKRDSQGNRTHHLHMVKAKSKLWDRLHFRDYLKQHPELVAKYEKIKTELLEKHPTDREAYTKGKTEFIVSITKKAKQFFTQKPNHDPSKKNP